MAFVKVVNKSNQVLPVLVINEKGQAVQKMLPALGSVEIRVSEVSPQLKALRDRGIIDLIEKK